MALYHTYRPQSFDDVLGQPHVVSVLRRAIQHDRVGHAYLLSGPRGVGKTSIARILAKAINCQTTDDRRRKTADSDSDLRPVISVPCNSCRACESITNGSALDVIEIDAASNRGIDEIRELRDRVRFAPTELRKKVYIIDEVHMLTKEAFNALLKTLEEPPEHAVFVLATTELQKIPETILSRCQHFHFRRAAPEALGKHLTAIAAQEHRTIEPEALELVVLTAEGSYRDALSAFEQLLVTTEGSTVTADQVRRLLGLPAEHWALDVIAAIAVGDRAQILHVLDTLATEGVSLESFVTELIRIVRLLLFVATLGADRVRGGSEAFQTAAPALLGQFTQAELVTLLERLAHVTAEMRVSPLPSLPFELALLVEAGKRTPSEVSSMKQAVRREKVAVPNQEAATPIPAAQDMEVQLHAPTNADPSKRQPAAVPEEHEAEPARSSLLGSHLQPQAAVVFGAAQWRELQQTIAGQDASVAMLIADLALPTLLETTLTIEVPYKFHADRLLSTKPRTLLTAAVQALVGQPIQIACAVNPALRARPASPVQVGTVIDDPVRALSEL